MEFTTEPERITFDVSTHTFCMPEKQLKSPEDITKWTASQAYSDLVGFILTLNEAVKNRKISDEYRVSDGTDSMVGLLDTIDSWIAEIPPIDQPQRFGNKAFRTLYTRLKRDGPIHVEKILPSYLSPAVSELSVYLLESFGNETRIDYGTGHELAFIAFLCCACKVGFFQEEDYPALVLKVFDRYLNLVRKLQMTYRMEPAGSQGVWSLDDFQFLPFLWGSAQLYEHPRIKPRSFPDEDIYNSFYKDYLFLAAIKYINMVKTGPFAEHSNQLWGISGVAGWPKVNSGLIKMYKAEVLGKFPVVQHFLFGSLLTLEAAPPCSGASSISASSSYGIAGITSPKASTLSSHSLLGSSALLSVNKSLASVKEKTQTQSDTASASESGSTLTDLSNS